MAQILYKDDDGVFQTLYDVNLSAEDKSAIIDLLNGQNIVLDSTADNATIAQGIQAALDNKYSEGLADSQAIYIGQYTGNVSNVDISNIIGNITTSSFAYTLSIPSGWYSCGTTGNGENVYYGCNGFSPSVSCTDGILKIAGNQLYVKGQHFSTTQGTNIKATIKLYYIK